MSFVLVEAASEEEMNACRRLSSTKTRLSLASLCALLSRPGELKPLDSCVRFTDRFLTHCESELREASAALVHAALEDDADGNCKFALELSASGPTLTRERCVAHALDWNPTCRSALQYFVRKTEAGRDLKVGRKVLMTWEEANRRLGEAPKEK